MQYKFKFYIILVIPCSPGCSGTECKYTITTNTPGHQKKADELFDISKLTKYDTKLEKGIMLLAF